MNNRDGKRVVRGPGRPKDSGARGRQSYSGKCDVRLSHEEDAALTRLAERNGVTRSDVMRRALRDYYRFNTDEGD